MRLADFILANVEPILESWEDFARSIWPTELTDPTTDPATLRDHAKDILRAAAADMRSYQSAQHRSDKSMGQAPEGPDSVRLDCASEKHGADRGASGFALWAVVAEYRALRASVVRLWRDSNPQLDLLYIDDLARFNESIDQSLAEAVRSYTEHVQREREDLLNKEQVAREDAELANNAKDIFLATLSHEMRTPLNAIVGWISILRTGDFSPENLAEGLDVIERNTNAQLQLMDDVLDVARIVSGKLRLDIRECDLTKAIQAGLDVVRPTADARDIRLDVQLGPDCSRAWCDAARIQQIVWNLLSNAIKFSPKGGRIRVVLEREGSTFRMAVIDKGKGIHSEFLPYVFDRFRQADDNTRRRFSGLGLGLSIVKHLTEMHGGSVAAQSEGEGLGSTFEVHIPIMAVGGENTGTDLGEDAFTTGEEVRLPLLRLDGLHVLIVDDEADARRMLLKALEGVGARVSTAACASDALDTLEAAKDTQDRPHILVSDIGMPEQDGYDLIQAVRKRGYEDLPALALTAFVRDVDVEKASCAGFQKHLAKPVNLAELTKEIAQLANRPPSSTETRGGSAAASDGAG